MVPKRFVLWETRRETQRDVHDGQGEEPRKNIYRRWQCHGCAMGLTMDDLEKHLIRSMSPPDRCAVWMMAALRVQELSELMSSEDVEVLKMMLNIIKDGKNDEQTNH